MSNAVFPIFIPKDIHVMRQFFEARGSQIHFFRKAKNVYRFGQGECVYQTSGLYPLSFGQGIDTK